MCTIATAVVQGSTGEVFMIRWALTLTLSLVWAVGCQPESSGPDESPNPTAADQAVQEPDSGPDPDVVAEKDAGDDITTDKPRPRSTLGNGDRDYRRTLELRLARDDAFMENLRKVQPGMTREEVLAVLGEPSRRTEEGSWFYSRPFPTRHQGVRVRGYSIEFEAGRVRKCLTDSATFTIKL